MPNRHHQRINGSGSLRARIARSPDYKIDDAPALDLLIVPGGRGARVYASKNAKILEFVRRQRGTVASVCTGAMVLAAAGILDGIEATTHCAHYHQLREHEKVQVREGVRFVMHDRIATSAGVTAGIDLALAFVARFFGEPIAQRIAENLEWKVITGAALVKNKPPRKLIRSGFPFCRDCCVLVSRLSSRA